MSRRPTELRRSPRPSSGPRTRAPVAVGELLARTFGAPLLKEKAEEYAAFPLWGEIVGETIARTAKPLKIIGGNVLVVEVVDAAWAQELSLRKEELLGTIHRKNVGAVIQDLKFVTGNPKRFSRR